ncbi:MAG TPA: antibiotic biosynthesis monooxygenase [Pirellulaceae bacterium]|nr:antibiotic biosynthesis monooxygenase [Pirellulaceae bacterium]
MNPNTQPSHPPPPYFAVVFSSTRSAAGAESARENDDGYATAAARMLELAATMPGYLGVESARGADGFGITVSYWRDEESIRQWQRHAEHLAAQEAGRKRWYQSYTLRVCRVERERSWSAQS